MAAGVVVATFFLLRLVPGDPAQAILGDRATDASVAALRLKLGLDLPLWQQFTDFVGQLLTHGDTGDSLIYGTSTRTLIAARIGVTIGIVALAIVFSLVIAVPLALLAATRKDSWIDHVIRAVPTVGFAMPVFWFGLLLIIVFAVHLHLLPVGGADQGIVSLILPAFAVSVSIVPPIVRSLRAQLLDVLDADFVATFRSAGLPRWRVLVFHVLRNAALPTLTLFGLNVAYLVGGTLVVERVFAINGLGALMFEAIGNRDFPLVQGIALFCAILVVIITVVTDFAVDRLDPRTRFGRA